MKKRKTIKISLWIVITGFITGIAVVIYLFNMPHRDIARKKADYALTASGIVREYLLDYETANRKYLAANGESKVLEITGRVKQISEDYEGHVVLLLKMPDDKAGVNCTFTDKSNTEAEHIKAGDKVRVKGVIRAGASWDEDLGLYENVILEKCTIIK